MRNFKYATPVILDIPAVEDDLYDAMQAAYQEEYDRWSWHRDDFKTRGSQYVLTRNSSPDGNINAEEYFERITFTKRECRNGDEAERWLETYRGRAACRRALAAARANKKA